MKAKRARASEAVRPAIMGILNITPDSFSDGGRYSRFDDAIAHATAMVEAGANIIDVGGESTRPGSERLTVDEELRRIMPVIKELIARDIAVSVDTMNSATAAAAADAGVEMINDVSGGLADREMGRIVAQTGLDYVISHWRGPSETKAVYRDVVRDVREELKHRVAEMIVWGVKPRRIILDPGLGFAKEAEHNWQLLGRLGELTSVGQRVLVGASRKRFLAPLVPDGAPTAERDAPTAVISALAAESGAWGVRVHDVAATRAALDVWSAWNDGRRTAASKAGA